jgi:hypothetical protein
VALFEVDFVDDVSHRLARDPDDYSERGIELPHHVDCPATASAQRNSARIAVALRGANRPKLKKRRLSQNTTNTSNGSSITIVFCSAKSHRVPMIALTSCSVCSLSQRWSGLLGSKGRHPACLRGRCRRRLQLTARTFQTAS